MVRGTERDRNGLWTDGIVYYTFHKSVGGKFRADINRAISTLESLTCLQFKRRRNERDYVVFSARQNTGCSSYIGRTGGRQTIDLGPGCEDQATILHEICHALGMWHEQSRPDRDNYVRILKDNIQGNALGQFRKRNKFYIDSIGSPYDYGSVMHYDLNAFAKRSGLKTMRVINRREYRQQGEPDIGFGPTLSKFDVTQLNRLYSCPRSGVPGYLTVHVRNAKNVKQMANAYVMVTAYDDKRNGTTKRTSYVNGTNDPVFDEILKFGSQDSWQYIEVSIWDYNNDESDTADDEQLTNVQIFSVNPWRHNHTHCDTRMCNTFLTFSTQLTRECHCYNGGACPSYGWRCRCPNNYSGTQCEYARGRLRIFARRGQNLKDRDRSVSARVSDPYLEVTAFDHNGGRKTLYTQVIRNSLNPVWNERLDFGENEWSWFTVQVWDEDRDYIQWLSYAYTFPLLTHTTQRRQRMNGFRGFIEFDYYFQP